MPRDSNGTTTPLPGTIVSSGDTLLPSQHNPAMEDLYAMMTQSLSRDGQGGMRANLDMSGFRILNIAAPTSNTDVATLGLVKDATPVGVILDYAGTTAPSKWAFCFGQALSRTGNADLFAAIGTTFGAGDGSTTFNVPDFRGRVSAGKDNMGGTSADRLTSPINGDVLGANGGSQSHTLSIGEIPSHNHGGSTGAGGAANLSVKSGASATAVSGTINSAFLTLTDQAGASFFNVVSSVPDHIHPIQLQGGGGGHNNMQPTIILNKIIKVSY